MQVAIHRRTSTRRTNLLGHGREQYNVFILGMGGCNACATLASREPSTTDRCRYARLITHPCKPLMLAVALPQGH